MCFWVLWGKSKKQNFYVFLERSDSNDIHFFGKEKKTPQWLSPHLSLSQVCLQVGVSQEVAHRSSEAAWHSASNGLMPAFPNERCV